MKNLNLKFVDPKATLFQKELRKRVNTYFKENGISKQANFQMILKSIILLAAYFVPFGFILAQTFNFPVNLLLWLLMGFALAGIGMSIMHDGNHGSYSKNKRVNDLMGATLNLLGGSILNWKYQHNVLHHTYTNITGMDDDIEDKLMLRFSPHTEKKWFHKLQPVYAFFFYGITTLYWITAKDFVQFVKYKANKVNRQTDKENAISLFKMILVKVGYFSVFFGFPLLFSVPIKDVALGFLLMHFVAGVTLTTIFQLAHSVKETEHPLPNDEGVIEDNWAAHQLKTTANFSKNNWFLTWYLGGLNYQIEHHLFPNICHVHYPNIAPIVKKTAKEFNLPYHDHGSFAKAVASHIGLMTKIA